jgi:hypothetical protein
LPTESPVGGISIVMIQSHLLGDKPFGKITLKLNLSKFTEVEKWWPLSGVVGASISNPQILIKVKYEGRHSAVQEVTDWLREINLEQYIDVCIYFILFFLCLFCFSLFF